MPPGDAIHPRACATMRAILPIGIIPRRLADADARNSIPAGRAVPKIGPPDRTTFDPGLVGFFPSRAIQAHSSARNIACN
jgi:hypothetical protein